jgi:hypothetical protein
MSKKMVLAKVWTKEHKSGKATTYAHTGKAYTA